MTNGNNLITANQLESVASAAVANALHSTFSGATANSPGTNGHVPAPSAGDQNKYLRGDGSWSTIVFILGTTPSTIEGAMWLEDD